MQWNLNDHLSTGGQRSFHLPVASDPLGGIQLPTAVPNDFLVKDVLLNPLPPCLEIKVGVPSGGLPDANGLPHPTIRLHAMLRGKLSYKPVFEGLNRCLILKIPPIWPRVSQTVKWFERWFEAGCLPQLIIYENVDEMHLRQMLGAMDPNNRLPNQILFPIQALGDGQKKTDFIDRFLAGSDADSVYVSPGTPIGKLREDFVSPLYKTMRLRIRYADHTDSNPHAMHPREFFHLLFGNDSREAQNHPVLRKIHQLGQQDTVTLPKTKRMLLRPPLRTHARLVWEADQELLETVTGSQWSTDAALDENKFLNSAEGFDRTNTYEGLNKCNLFAFEVLFRSGFRVRMTRWTDPSDGIVHVYYYRVNRLVREARDVDLSLGKPGMLGYVGEPVWGRRWDIVLNTKPVAEQGAEINRLMEEEGRGFYLLREFDSGDHSGHFMIVNRVEESFPADFPLEGLRGAPTIEWENKGSTSRGTKIGVGYIYVNVYEAIKAGLHQLTTLVFPSWPEFVTAKWKSLAKRDNDLLLIEACPGKDPDSETGRRDLCSIHERAQ